MSDPVNHPKVCFNVASARDVGHRIAQLLAMGELQGPFWLRATLLWVQLLPDRVMRIVLSVPPEDLNRVLSVDNWATLYMPSMVHTALKIAEMPQYTYAEEWHAGPPRSNLAAAKSLTELLLLLLREMSLVERRDDYLQMAFWRTICSVGYDSKPAAITDSQCEGLMEMADAWRDHLVSVWAQPGRVFFERFSRKPPLTEQVLHKEAPVPMPMPAAPEPRFKPSEFPALGDSPTALSVHDNGVAPVDREEAGRLWKVAWLDQSQQARIWLGRGASPQSMASGN